MLVEPNRYHVGSHLRNLKLSDHLGGFILKHQISEEFVTWCCYSHNVYIGKYSIMEHLGFVFAQIVANWGVFHFCEGLVEQTWKSRWLSASPSWGRWISSSKSLKPCGNLCAVFHGHQIPQTIIASIVGLLHRSRLLSKTFISQVWYRKSRKNWLLKFPWRTHGAGTFTYYFLPWKTNQTVGKYTVSSHGSVMGHLTSSNYQATSGASVSCASTA